MKPWTRTGRLVLALGLVGLAGAGTVLESSASPPPLAEVEIEDRASAPWETAPGASRLADRPRRAEPPSRHGNPPSYVVRGATYYPVKSAAGYREEGVASWYGGMFHGRRTSSGETYDMHKLTAAHRTLPIPTSVRVTNLENGLETVVRVNDRGPFHDGRMLDLSYAAAVKLGFSHQGTARVRVEAMDGRGALYLQAGAFRGKALAEGLGRNLAALTGERTEVVQQPNDSLYRVLIGPFAEEGRARRLQSLIAAANFARPFILRIGRH